MKGTSQTVDDGAYAHLQRGTTLPEVSLPATTGETLDIVSPAEFTALFLYPMTGTPGQPLPEGWLELPGAYGCTAESCGYRDLARELDRAGARVYGVSTQTRAEQSEFAEREQINYPMLSDAERRLVDAMRLPLLEIPGEPPRIKRATLIVNRTRELREVMYPIPDPGANAVHALETVRRLATTRPG